MACEHLCANGNYVGLGEGFSFPNEAWYSSFKLIMHTVFNISVLFHFGFSNYTV